MHTSLSFFVLLALVLSCARSYFWLDTWLQPGLNLMRGLLSFHGVEFKYHREPGARHNERAWGERIDRPLLHLYGKPEMPSRHLKWL